MRKKVYVCSPLKGDGTADTIRMNMDKARGYARQAFLEGCDPLVPHIYYPSFLDENDPIQRTFGLDSGLCWLRECDELWVCASDSGSEGMAVEISMAKELNIPILFKYDHPMAVK